MIGATLSSRYEILRQLGQGGMAVTYAARDSMLNREVAVKVLRSEFAADADFCARFHREAQAAGKLKHPNIVAIHDIARDGDNLYIVMEMVDGQDLRSLLDGRGALSQNDALRIASQVCDALATAHAAGIIHRDIKPHNILITSHGVVKVIDFGIAKAMTPDATSHTRQLLGTVHYMSPEQATGSPVGPQTDIYSLGVVLFEMLTGQTPFDGETPVAIAFKHASEPPPDPRSLNSQIGEGAATICLRALQKNPAARQHSAADMLAELKIAAGETARVSSAPPPPAPQPGQWREKTLLQPPQHRSSQPAHAEPTHDRPPANPVGILAAILVAIILVAGGTYLGVRSMTNQKVTAPDVVGMSRLQAQMTINQHRLTVGRISEEFSSVVPEDRVIRQQPAAAEEVEQGAAIDLVISRGSEVSVVEVPDLAELPYNRAVKELEKVGLRVGEVTHEYSEMVPRGCLIRQSPRSGVRIEGGADIDIWVSDGPEPKPEPEPVPVPEPENGGVEPGPEPAPGPEPTPAPAPTPTPPPSPGPSHPDTQPVPPPPPTHPLPGGGGTDKTSPPPTTLDGPGTDQ